MNVEKTSTRNRIKSDPQRDRPDDQLSFWPLCYYPAFADFVVYILAFLYMRSLGVSISPCLERKTEGRLSKATTGRNIHSGMSFSIYTFVNIWWTRFDFSPFDRKPQSTVARAITRARVRCALCSGRISVCLSETPFETSGCSFDPSTCFLHQA